jgi:hypothetical protein
MKKIIGSILVFLFIGLPVYTQVKGVDLDKATPFKSNSKTFKNYEDLLAYNGAYCITYILAPIGLQHCLEKLKDLLLQNNLDFNHPHIDKSFLTGNINESLDNYMNLHAGIQAQTSEVNRTWELQDGWYITLNLTFNAYTIWFIPADRKK